MQEDALDKYIYCLDAEHQRQILAEKRWEKDQTYFRNVKITMLALFKMIRHALKGEKIEVMGLMYGKIEGCTFIITDAFALPVEGTETRVDAQAEGYEYMVGHISQSKKMGKAENVVGWYHSHPGYGCWLSGIDVSNQKLQQTYQDPFVAIVIDPFETLKTKKVVIGAYRTFVTPLKSERASYASSKVIPPEKALDYGAHKDDYYELQVEFLKSSLDFKVLSALYSSIWADDVLSALKLDLEGVNLYLCELGDKFIACQKQIHQFGEQKYMEFGQFKEIQEEYAALIEFLGEYSQCKVKIQSMLAHLSADK